MAKFMWRSVSVGFWKETTRGTSVAPSFWFPKTGTNYEDKFETVLDEASYGTINDSAGHSIVSKYSEGEVTGNLSVNAITLPLYSLFGSVVTTTDTGTAKKHTFNVLESAQQPSLTIAMHDPIQAYRFALGVVKSITFKVEPKKRVEVSIELMGKPGSTSTETVAFATDYQLLASHSSLAFASALAGLDAASPTANCIKSFEITFKREIIADECVASTSPVDYLSTVFSVEGNMEITYENEADYKAKALAGSTQAMRFQILDGTTIIGGVSSSPELEIDLAKVGFTEWSHTRSTNEIVTQSVGFKGFYSLADAKACVVRLVNTIASI